MTHRTSIPLPAALLLIAILILIPVSAAGNLVPADILQMEQMGHFTMSPDGVTLVYVKSLGSDLAPPQGNGTLMYINVQSGTETALSDPAESVLAFALSPDGTRVAYATMPRIGGDESLAIVRIADKTITRYPDAPVELFTGFFWLGNDRLVYLGAPDMPVKPELPGDVIVADEIPDPVILKSWSPATETITQLSKNKDVITIWAPSPDGRYVLYKAATYPEEWLTSPMFRYRILDTATGTEEELLSRVEGFEDENEFAWSPDSTTVYIEWMQNGGIRYPVEYTSDLLAYFPKSGTLEEVPLRWDDGLHIDLFNADIEVNPFNGGTYVFLSGGANPVLARYIRIPGGWSMTRMTGQHEGNIFALETDSTGTLLAYNYNSASVPPQIYAASARNDSIVDPVQLTRLNRNFVKKPSILSEVTTWTGALGDTITGVVRYPPGYTPGKQYPLIIVIHGGPTYADFDSWRDTWEFPYHLFTDRGAVTLSVNYHGSTNFGFDFAQSIEGGHYYDYPIEDILAGVDHLEARGIINRSQVGVTGWSNGGILTLALITKDPNLKAAVAGAGTADEGSQTANTNGAVMDRMYYAASPYQDPDAFLNVLPIYNAKNVTTPLLMLIGTDDNAVVPAGAWATYRTYKEESRAPVRFILFRNEPHHPTLYANQLRKVDEELGWFDRHLFSPG